MQRISRSLFFRIPFKKRDGNCWNRLWNLAIFCCSFSLQTFFVFFFFEYFYSSAFFSTGAFSQGFFFHNLLFFWGHYAVYSLSILLTHLAIDSDAHWLWYDKHLRYRYALLIKWLFDFILLSANISRWEVICWVFIR